MERIVPDVWYQILILLEYEDIINTCISNMQMSIFCKSDRTKKPLKEKLPKYKLKQLYGLEYPPGREHHYALPKDLDPNGALKIAKQLTTYLFSQHIYPTVNALTLLVGYETEESREYFLDYDEDCPFPHIYFIGEAAVDIESFEKPNNQQVKEYLSERRILKTYMGDVESVFDKIYKQTRYVLPQGVVTIPFDADYVSLLQHVDWEENSLNVWLDNQAKKAYGKIE